MSKYLNEVSRLIRAYAKTIKVANDQRRYLDGSALFYLADLVEVEEPGFTYEIGCEFLDICPDCSYRNSQCDCDKEEDFWAKLKEDKEMQDARSLAYDLSPDREFD